jgi:hypothetical protein
VNVKFPLAGAALALALAFGATGAQAATNLLTNGDFETGDATGWTVTGVDVGVVGSGFDGMNAESGNYFMALGTVGVPGTISQTVSDTAGQALVLNYYYMSSGNAPSSFAADWDGVQIAGSAVSDAPASGYVDYQFNVTATGSDTLTFLERDDPAFDALDNVSLTPTAAVPEPATWAMLILGVAMVGFTARRRREGFALAA